MVYDISVDRILTELPTTTGKQKLTKAKFWVKLNNCHHNREGQYTKWSK